MRGLIALFARLALLALVPGLLIPACGDSRSHEARLLLLLTVDTLRTDRVGAYGSELDLTPNLDALARESEVFSNAFAPAPFTLPSLVALHSGLYPEQAGVHSNNSPLPSGVPTIAQLLRADGWRTAAVVSNYVVRERSGLAAGFDHYDARFPQLEAVRQLPERTASATSDHAIEMLDALLADDPGRIFLWVHYQDPHGPYLPPGDLRMRYLAHEQAQPDGSRELEIEPAGLGGLPLYQALHPSEREAEENTEQETAEKQRPVERSVALYRAGYDGEVRYVDRELGRLLDAIEERGLADRATIVFAADHGESLGERDYWFAHGEYLNEVVMRVPLMFRVPGRSPRMRSELAGLVDVLPTLAAHLSITASGDGRRPGRDLPGRDLFEELATHSARALLVSNLGVATVPRHGVVTDDHRLVVEASPEARAAPLSVRAYRLGAQEPMAIDGADDVNGATVAELSARLRLLRAAFPSRRPLSAPLSAEEIERLRALGYLAQ